MALCKQLIISLILLFVSFSQCQIYAMENVKLTKEERAWLSQNHVVRARVGEAPPLHFYDGKFQGISVDYLNMIAKRAGFKVQYVTDIPWSNALGHIKNHQVVDEILGHAK
ncbi:MAG: transporter substrate-binding domain-containing protein [Deltaproteobacteria bacterium]|nr:transporter substrate-binding domain-containing protein [Deltaproteobacteria bacterium]